MWKEEFQQINAKDITVWQILSYSFKKIKPYKWILIICMVLMILSSACDVYVPVFSSKIVDIAQLDWIEIRESVCQLFKLLWVIWILLLVETIFQRITWGLMSTIELKWMKDIKCECFDYLNQHSYRFFANSFSGSLVRKINKLSGSFEWILDIFMGSILSIIISLPLMMVVIMKESALVWIIFLIFWIIFTIINILFVKNNLKYEHLCNEKDSVMTGELSDSVTNAFNVITFASHEREYNRFQWTVDNRLGARKTKLLRINRFSLWVRILSIAFRICSLWVCIWYRWKWYIAVSVIILVQLYVGKFTWLLENVVSIFKRMNRIIWESAEMLAILKTPHEIQDKTNKKLKIKEWKIEFQNVDFWYLIDDPIVEDLNMVIKPWEKVAIVGESGSWKTTTIKLLFRLFDLRNWKILIDGQDISQVTQDSLRRQLSMVPQDALLFHRSVRDNIAYWKPDATEKEIIAAAKMARCHDFILNLPEWYDSLVWERGIKLSWWERQRIAIARAILENCKILVLDEATSSLDSESEFLIQAAMDEVMKNKTAIVIAHRLSTIMKMDRIIVMDEWVIVEEWTHEELIKKKWWVYHKLWSIQSWWFITPDEWDKINFQPKEEEEKDDL